MTAANFISDVRRFGRARAFRRLEHDDRRREFRLRQVELAAAGFGVLAFYALSGQTLLAGIAVLLLTTAERECRRYKACGRYWQCRRSIEAIGI